jgi:signal transduction histidine kinase/ActR/RegA family two-component response regulator
MKLTPAVAAVPLLLLLLTWLLLQGMNPDAQLSAQAIAALDDFALAESALHRDVLSARAGLLHNYDSLVREDKALNGALERLHEAEAAFSESRAPIAELAAAVARQEMLTERFKSDNALLQNSLTYFGMFSVKLGASDLNGPIFPAVSELAAAMLHLTLDTSPPAAQAVAARLDGLATQTFPAGDADSLQALLAHGRMLHDLLPVTDRLVKALVAMPSLETQEAVRRVVLTRQAESEERAGQFRILLYATSLLLLGFLVHLGLQLRARASALRQRAALEHVIAGISTRFISLRPREVDSHIEQALAQLARCIGADRAYFILSGTPARMHGWCREGAGFPPGWPARASALAARFPATEEGIVHVPRVDRLPSGADKSALAAAGLRGWACVPSGQGVPAVLGFDALRTAMTTPADELSLLRMALDALSNAVRRETLERDRARLETSLQQARRMETIGALASGIAHNFNNIVGAILGYTEMAEAQVVTGSRPAHNLAEIRRAGEQARNLVDQILAFGRRRDIRRQPVSVKALIAETCSLLHASLPSGIELVVRGSGESAAISGAPEQIQQVMLNLCNNAAQAMDGKGAIEVEAAICDIAQSMALSHGDLAPGCYARLSVIDSGRGMDEALLERIFEPFFTTRLGGYGLGLATVREIVREHGGAMNVRSAPGAGSRFEAWLPCSTAPESLADEAEPVLPLGHGETLLVLDDDRAQLTRAEETMAALGYEPVGFTRPGEALAACRAAPERFDVLVLHQLATLGATLDLAAALHKIAPDLPILLATASADEVDAEILMAVGISEVVRRPFMSIEIAAALSRCLKSDRLKAA